MYVFTEEGEKHVREYVADLEAKRKEILDAGIDTAECTHIPTVDEILEDLNDGILENEDDDDSPAEYEGVWSVTDHYEGDLPLRLEADIDIVWEED